MSTRLKEKQEKIQQIITWLAEESAKDTLIVVEGKKDAETLRSLDVCGPILTAKTGGKPLGEILLEIERTGAKEVILMLDFDRRGREATAYLTASLERLRIKPNRLFWRELSALVGREVQCIEGLTSYLQTLQQKTA